MTMAVIMVARMPRQASGVSGPAIHASPPPNSAIAAMAWSHPGGPSGPIHEVGFSVFGAP